MNDITHKTLDYYETNADAFYNTTLNVDMTLSYKLLLKHLHKGEAILDLGCGSGRDSRYFMEKGYQVVSVDGSKELCMKASAYLGQAVQCMDFMEINYNNQFEAVWACSSLLHLSKEDLITVLEKVYRALKPDGYLYISFKYGDFSGFRNGRYFLDLTESSLQDLVRQTNNFEIIETLVTMDARPDRSDEKWLNAILKKR